MLTKKYEMTIPTEKVQHSTRETDIANQKQKLADLFSYSNKILESYYTS